MNTLRHHFPYFNHHPDHVYLDSAATAQKPESVLTAMHDYFLHGAVNVHRGAYQRANHITGAFEHARTVVAQFINAPDPRSIVWTRGSTEAINLVAFSYGEKQIHAGDVIVVSALEHHANFVPWQQLCARKNATLRVLPITADGAIDEQHIDDVIDDHVKLVAITAMSNVLGTVTPVKKIIARAHARGAVVLVDAAQAIVHQAIDVQQLDCDFLVFSAHKVYGPTGLGVLYGKYEHLDDMVPWQTGGEMVQSVSVSQTLFQPPPLRFEAGTPPIAEVIGLSAALTFLQSLDRDAIFAREHALMTRLENALGEFSEVNRFSNAPQRQALVSFAVDGLHHTDIAAQLDHAGVAVRAGQLCAMPLLQRLNVAGVVRVSFGLYSDERDVDAFINALRPIINAERKTLQPATNADTFTSSSTFLEALKNARGWLAKQRLLLQHGGEQKPWSRAERERAIAISGCESATWLRVHKNADTLIFELDSEARIVAGLGAVILALVNHHSAQHIAAIDFEQELQSLGISGQLSPSRRHGVWAIITTIKQLIVVTD